MKKLNKKELLFINKQAKKVSITIVITLFIILFVKYFLIQI
jgi:hypothetical protein